MAHAHAHGLRGLDGRREDTRRRMWIALAINVALLGVEVVTGLITGSLALLADAGHLLSDVGSIGLALFAATLASRPSGPRRTFGYQRSEIIAALVNGLLLVAVSVAIVVAAVGRLSDPPDVAGGGVLAVGALGLAGNLAAAAVLARGQRSDVNLEGVLRHSAADALGSIGVLVSGAVLLTVGWEAIDPLVSLAIAALVLASSWRLIREPLDVLMEAAPADMDVEDIGAAICSEPHVREVHELHLWTVTSGFEALAAHVVVDREADRDLVRRRLEVLLTERFGLDHTTLQMEESADRELLEVEETSES
jgi:cobalt-zinc-cadmium efflux system protein